MRKNYETPISLFMVINSTDVLAKSNNATLNFNSGNEVDIDSRDIRSFSGFFDN